MRLMFQYGEEMLTLEAQAEGNGFRVWLPDGSEHFLTVRRLPDDRLQLTVNDANSHRIFRVPTAHTEHGIEVAFDGRSFAFAPVSERQEKRTRKADSGLLVAPMVGVVADVMVTAGQTVEAYQPLVVVEAMKVMATIDAPFAGIVKSVLVAKGERVGHGAPVVEVVPAEQADS